MTILLGQKRDVLAVKSHPATKAAFFFPLSYTHKIRLLCTVAAVLLFSVYKHRHKSRKKRKHCVRFMYRPANTTAFSNFIYIRLATVFLHQHVETSLNYLFKCALNFSHVKAKFNFEISPFRCFTWVQHVISN